jgi:hypothetical protein
VDTHRRIVVRAADALLCFSRAADENASGCDQ